jgi:electron transfer flavoprotein alpha subunit
MERLIIHHERVTKPAELIDICPFAAIEEENGVLTINAACTMCKVCVNSTPGWVELVHSVEKGTDKSLWRGIAVHVEHELGRVQPVTYELLGKARELADKVGFPVYAVLIGANIADAAQELLFYGPDKIFTYDHDELKYYLAEPYTAVWESFVQAEKPSVILMGATIAGRSLAPRLAARLRTGLTADCTVLDIKDNTDLVQIRPAFGGNIMAEIYTTNHRPQLATVRPKVLPTPVKSQEHKGVVITGSLAGVNLSSKVTLEAVLPQDQDPCISEAEVVVVAGRGAADKRGLGLVNELALLLGARVAGTRPLIESGQFRARDQIGLSGRTVAPRLIITCGVSGAVQFTAGMRGAECIIAINSDPQAPVFKVAHYGIVGDVHEVLTELIARIRRGQEI